MIQLWGVRGRTEPTGLASVAVAYHVESMADALGSDLPRPADMPADLIENWGLRGFEKWWDGGYIVNAVFEGLSDTTRHQWGFYPSFKEAKLVSHPQFQDLLAKYGGTYDPTTGVIIWQASLDGGAAGGLPGSSAGQTNPNPMFGQDSYAEVAVIYRSSKVLMAPPRDSLSRIGTVFDTLPDGVDVETPEGRNWVVMPSPFVKRGEVYEDNDEWLLSPPGRKWDDSIGDFILGLTGQ